ncbi:VOC family protein [Nostoc sp. FACHB-888]|uniref:VOC family protein n=1 Tax=Nostoc sp. FACHB-888 TaxID=2692842 RepID=UPI001685D64B|nr:VOC family protein [Nostoc sp. FACHB-888]MBD2249458.1 VOC family protein [Nostoc sp. FACHB-888]
MIDHIGVVVSDFERSKSFYAAALEPVGLSLIAEYSTSTTGSTDIAGFGQPPEAEFWLSLGNPGSVRVHIAFRVHNHAAVEGFYNAALAAGGRDNGAPGLRPQYHPNYYAAFVLDPDGHNIEAVCHQPE